MMRFLKKYRYNIILALLLTTLAFWYNPRQQNLYLKSDFESIGKLSSTVLLWTLCVAAIIILAVTVKGAKKMGEVGNILLGIAVMSIPIYFVFKTFFLSGLLALNRIELPDHLEKKYTTFLLNTDRKTPVLYDFRTGKTLFFDKVERVEKLDRLKPGDTVVISFRKGLIGIPFKPTIK